MSALDSRALTYLDCFGQRFTEAGTIRYAIGGPVAACLNLDELTYVIEATENGGEQQQHDVEVHVRNGALTPATRRLEIGVGDVVLWHAPDSGTPPYAVWGVDAAGRAFSSAAMEGAAVYSHAFGSPGDVAWVDANHGRAHGMIKVREMDRDDRDQCQQWARLLAEGVVVVIENGEVEPQELDIVTGQTVFFAVAGDTGITVTDQALIDRKLPEPR